MLESTFLHANHRAQVVHLSSELFPTYLYLYQLSSPPRPLTGLSPVEDLVTPNNLTDIWYFHIY